MHLKQRCTLLAQVSPLACQVGRGEPPAVDGIRPEVWTGLTAAQPSSAEGPSEAVLVLLEQRKQAINKDFAASDRLRDEIAALGWKVKDTKEGQSGESGVSKRPITTRTRVPPQCPIASPLGSCQYGRHPTEKQTITSVKNHQPTSLRILARACSVLWG
ncbi:MAG: hypothetical protein IPG80_04565 [Anaerolineales bacterium]|uniref:CysS/YqeB C-terminal domain-containing protein n=1 Tax=Candidatus Villigracilis vicinus TaxID=3140679 RepID=UPI00313506FC|nr:hypothetical protein [Anaerolineales bacterium]